VIPVPNHSVQVDLDAGQASFRLTSQTVFDDHDIHSSLTKMYPPGFPKMAEVTFDVEWGGIIDTAHVTNEASNFEGNFAYTGSTIQWSANGPDGFQFTSESNQSQVVGAVLGKERNGVFFQ